MELLKNWRFQEVLGQTADFVKDESWAGSLSHISQERMQGAKMSYLTAVYDPYSEQLCVEAPDSTGNQGFCGHSRPNDFWEAQIAH